MADFPKERGVTKNVDCGLIFQDNAGCGYRVVVFVEVFGAPSIGNTPVSLTWFGEGAFQVTLGGTVG